MSQYTSYYLYQKYEKRGEQDWIPVYPNVYSVDGDGTMPLSAKTENDPACGYTPVIEPIYRWVNMNITSNWICDDCPVQPIYRWDVLSPSTDYICYSGDKYYKEVYQVSYDNGNSWSNVIPEEYERGPLYEANSDDCFSGYSFVINYSDMSTPLSSTCEQTTQITSAITHNSHYSAITSVFVGYCITAIGNKAFARSGTSSSVLSSVTFDDASQLSSIGDSAFTYCTSLSSITIPSGVTSIGDMAFYSCSGLTSVTIPSGVTSIMDSVFQGCSSLTSCTIGSGVTSIGYNAFRNCSSLTSVNIPSGVTEIGNSAFTYCTSLSSITIPDSVTNISNYAFRQCYSLTSANIPSGVTYIGWGAFQDCSGLTNVTIDNGVISTGRYTFKGCTSLSSITIPDSVTNIDAEAFYGCSGLTSITVNRTTPPTLSSGAFNYTNNCPIYVPSGSVNAYKTANKWSDYADRIQAIT